MENVGIYSLTSPSGKVYIGQSRQINGRFSKYRTLQCKTQPKLINSLKKHSFNSHDSIVVMPLRPDVNNNMMDYWERFMMDYYRSINVELLNTKEAGSKGAHSIETKIKIGIGNTGKKRSEEARSKYSVYHKNKKLSDETKKRIGLAHKGMKRSDLTKLKISLGNKGNHSWANHPLFGKTGTDHHSAVSVDQFSRDGKFIKTWCCTKNAIDALNIKTSISDCCRGKRKMAGGFIWSYSKHQKNGNKRILQYI
jgi:group I intron endonuclease